MTDSDDPAPREVALLRREIERLVRWNRHLRSAADPLAGNLLPARLVVLPPEAPPAPPTPPPTGTDARRHEAAWMRAGDPPFPLRPTPGLACAELGTAGVTVVGVHAFGLAGTALADAVASIDRLQQRTRSFVPVFLTDACEQAPFATHGYALEYFPAHIYRLGDGRLAWELIDPRLRFLTRKWSIARTMDMSAVDDRRPAPAATRKTAPPAAAAGAASADEIRLVRESGLFDEAWYMRTYPEAAATHDDPIRHYLEIGAARGFDPHPLFQTSHYAARMAVRPDAEGDD